MAVAALIIAIVALLLCAVLALALMELVASRPAEPGPVAEDALEVFELPDRAPGSTPDSYGPAAVAGGDGAHLALFVSPVCATCGRLAASFEGDIPDHLTVVVTAASPARMRRWAEARGLPSGEVVFDDDMSIVEGLGVASSPAVVGFVDGRPVFAAHVGGRSALDEAMAQRDALFRAAEP